MPDLILGPTRSNAPSQYTLAPRQAIIPESITATFNGSGAAGAFLPTVSVYSQDGVLIARCPASSVAAGSSAEVTFAPLLRAATSAVASGGDFALIERQAQGATWFPDFQSIPQTFHHLCLVILAKINFSSEVDGFRFNADAGANYEAQSISQDDGAGLIGGGFTPETAAYVGPFAGNTGLGNDPAGASAYTVWIPEYTGTTFHKLVISHGGYILDPLAPPNADNVNLFSSRWKNTAAITRVTFTSSGGFLPGSSASLYGIN